MNQTFLPKPEAAHTNEQDRERLREKRNELLRKIAEHRRQQSQVVSANPANFKICRGCSSLLYKNTVFCPCCKAYGFDDDPAAIVELATMLGNRPIAVGTAVLPRGTTPAELKNV